MNKIITFFVAFTLLISFSLPVSAITENNNLSNNLSEEAIEENINSLQEIISQLALQIENLRQKIQELERAREQVREQAQEIGETIRVNMQLWKGLKNEDVKLLQEFLATDPEIYPEGLVTGYFGPLTEQAVKRFQKMTGIQQVGRVGPKTMSKINELLEEGAGDSGKVPPGLLIAPGIRKKLGFDPEPMDGQHLPYGICMRLGYENCIPDGDEEDEEIDDEEVIGIIGYDECGIGKGWSEPQSAAKKCFRPSGEIIDCCCCYLKSHIHDLGKIFKDKEVLIKYMPGWAKGCTSDMTVYSSINGEDWDEIMTKEVTQETWSPKTIYEETISVTGEFRYIKIYIPNCYNDHSSALVLD